MVVLGSGGNRWEMDVDGERWWWEVVVRDGVRAGCGGNFWLKAVVGCGCGRRW